MKDDARDNRLEFLFKGILTLDSVEDCYQFFSDLCTPFELQEMAQRMQAAKMLKDGLIYNEIAERTGLSTATISRVGRLCQGSRRAGSARKTRLAQPPLNKERETYVSQP